MNTFEKYQNPAIKKQLTQRGFCVYEYIDSKEFLDSIEKRYLQGLLGVRRWEILLGIAGIVLLFVNILWTVYVAYAFIFLHVCLFLWLSVHTIEHMRYFLRAKYVIYTPKGIIVGKRIFSSADDPELAQIFNKIHRLFDEPIAQLSQLENNLHEERKEFFQKYLYFERINQGKMGPATLVRFFLSGIVFLISYVFWKVFLLFIRGVEI